MSTRSIRTKRVVLMAALVVSLCLCAAAVRRHRAIASTDATISKPIVPELAGPSGVAPLTGAALAAVMPQASPSPSPTLTPTVQTLGVWMYGQYLYPLTIYATPGPSLLVIHNQTTQSNITLACLPSGSSGSSTTVSTQGQTNSSVGGAPLTGTTVVNLSPNTQYTFYDVNNPAVTGVIVVGSN